jgi:Protein of unknown function (DUF3551)
VLKTFALLALGIAACTASLFFCTSPSRAFNDDAPWCLIGYEGNLHCYYATSQACLQEIAGGSRGFCTQNPAGSAAAAQTQSEPRTQRRRQ